MFIVIYFNKVHIGVETMPELSTRCPYCFAKMDVKKLACQSCATEVVSDFSMPRFLELSADQQEFAIEFILASGSLKEMAKILDVSYPTVRAKLDRVIECLRDEKSSEEERRAAILDAVEEKKISTQRASQLLSDQSEDK
jgi:hypothetical protein